MTAAGAPAALGAAAPETVALAEALEDLMAIQTVGGLMHLRSFHPEYVAEIDAQRASFDAQLAAPSRRGVARRRRWKGKDTLFGHTGSGTRRR